MKKIYIVEDEINLASALEAKLRERGYATECDPGADDIDGIIGRAALSRPDYIITDLTLPRVDGYELLSAFKAHPETRALPVFVFSDMSDADARARSERLGGDFYLLKSKTEIDPLVDRIAAIIRNRERLTLIR